MQCVAKTRLQRRACCLRRGLVRRGREEGAKRGPGSQVGKLPMWGEHCMVFISEREKPGEGAK